MGTLCLYAMPLDDVRAFFAAPPRLAGELITQAGDVIPEPPRLIRKLGPLVRRPAAPLVDLPGPTADDARALVEGRSLPPERLAPAWVIIRHWCDLHAAAKIAFDLTSKQIENLDFCLVSGGLSSQFSLGTMIARDPHLPVRPAPGLQVGWIPHHYVVQAEAQWRDTVAECPVADDDLVAVKDQLAEFFAHLSDAADGPQMDLLALFQ